LAKCGSRSSGSLRVEPEEFAAIKAIADQFEEISFAVGLHPLDAQKWRDNSADQIES
jgi:TatD DNase family protein